MAKKLYVLLGDVINSRAIKNRKQFEKKFHSALEKVMMLQADLFALPVKQWKGIDEIAAVVKHPGKVYKAITIINEELDPQMMRFVLARDEVDIYPKTKDISMLDGQVFHEAANKMMEIKKEKWLFGYAGDTSREAIALNLQINSLLLIRSGWSETQRKIFYTYSDTGNQEKTAKKLKITQQSVSKTLKLIAAAQVIELENNLTQWADAGFTDQ